MDLDEFKAFQRELWETGDYRPAGRLLEPTADVLVRAAGVTAGQRVLDVATGSGNVAIAAARAGAQVVGVDITDRWFDEARRRAKDAGVDVTLEVGDAEDLPVAPGAFDVVLSNFGVIFAPRHEVVAAQLARACRPGGTIAMTAWPPDNTNRRVFSPLAAELPPPPDFVQPSGRWGEPEVVERLFAAHGVDVTFSHPELVVEFPSTDAFLAFVFDNSGSYIQARQELERTGRWEPVLAQIRQGLSDANEADDGSYRATWDYLLTVGTTRAA